MEKVYPDDPLVREISGEWLDYLETLELPERATAISIGQALMHLMLEYEPPVEEMSKVMTLVMATYEKLQHQHGYMN